MNKKSPRNRRAMPDVSGGGLVINNMVNKTKNTMCLTFKVKVPHKFSFILDKLYSKCNVEVVRMLKNRKKSSSKFYPRIPCVVAKRISFARCH